MKTVSLVAGAGLIQAALASAIPSVGHKKFHHERRDNVAPIIETVTTTIYQTVIWVDKNGNPVSTEINDAPAQPLATPTSPPVQAAGPPNQAVDNQPWRQHPPPQPSHQPPQQPQHSASPRPPPASQSSSPQPTGNTGGGGGQASSGSAPGGMGICYDMIDSQSKCKDTGTINSEFSFLKSQGFGMVRVYDIGCPVGDFVAGASQNGLKIMVGINSISSLQSDLSKLIGDVNGNWASVDTVYIGNEVVNGGHSAAGDVAAAVTTARGSLKAAGYTGNVITVDTFNVMQTDPTICSTSDYCAANAHAFFDPNTAADGAGNFVLNAYNAVVKANSGKKVIISESGWPWRGSCNGQACPSPENQKTAMNGIMKSFASMPGNLFLFQGYDAGYKQPGTLGIEQFFGIYDSDHYTGGIGPA